MKFKIGSPVTGPNFFPRPEVIDEILGALEEDHFIFLAPRRTGKISILLHIRDEVENDTVCF